MAAAEIPATNEVLLQTDSSKQFLDALLGQGWETWGQQLGGSQAAELMLQIFGTFNLVALAIISGLFIWVMALAVAGTAHEGVPFGKRYSSLWMPVRFVGAMGALAPIFKGLSLFQVALLACIGWSINLGNYVWELGVDYFVEQGGQLTVQAPDQNVSKYSTLANGVLESLTLQYYLRDRRGLEVQPGGQWGNYSENTITRGGEYSFFFNNNVHVMSDVQEGWSDSLYFYRNTMNVDMLGDAQVTDTSRNVSGLAGHISYVDSLARVTMTRTPAVVAEIEDQESGRDTVFFGADTLIYYTVRMCDVDSMAVVDAAARLSSMDVDPVSEFRKKAAAEAAKAAEEAAKNDPNRRPDTPPGKTGTKQKPDKAKEADMANADSLSAAADSLSVGPDSLSVGLDSLSAGLDSLSAGADSLALADSAVTPPVEPDTTKIGFVKALNNVKIYRRNMQIVCDSLEYCDLDSIARLFKQPVIWNEVTQQYVADSVYALVRGSRMEKVSLMSNAFVHNQQDSVHYDQIRSTEMMAYFDADSQLSRFDALGGASALFYLEENDVLATANKKDTKMLSAVFKDGTIHKIYYFDTVKSDAYPVAQMTQEEQVLKGFNWQPDLRPEDRFAITSQELRSPQRTYYSSRPRARFVQTGLYFPGYIDEIYTQIEERDSLARVRERQRQILEQDRERHERFVKDSIAIARLDSIAVADSIALSDSLAFVADSLERADSISMADSIRQQEIADSLASVVPTKEQLKEQARKEREEKKAARIAEREKRWADKDQKDADKEKAKEEKKKAKERERKLKLILAAQEEAMADSMKLEIYKEKYLLKAEKQKAREEKKAARKKNRPQAPPEQGEAVVLPEKDEEKL